MNIRRATPGDYSGIFELAAACYEQNLSPAERRQGFLSAQFTSRQIADMAEDLGIIVASEEERVVGFACASRFDGEGQPPIVKTMIAEFERIHFRGRPLQEYRLFLYGPACLDPAYRGRGLLRRLYREINRGVAGKYDVGSAFVSEDNPHSLKAHVDGLGMSDVGRFAHDGRDYHILAFAVEPGNDVLQP